MLTKLWYRQADFDQLRWVLEPTARLASWMSGIAFELEPHHGYLSRAARFEIVPACAGVNFMIALFLSLVVAVVLAGGSRGRTPARLVTCAPAAAGVTILANGTRLALAVRLHVASFAFGPLDPGRIHHVEGTLVYFTFLMLTYAIALRAMRVHDAR
jgi:exosortase K